MADIPARRGRPKGTGIDDADRLARLTEMLRNRPELKPTTAIRLMGYSDPSAIRRLRDKYKAFHLSAAASLTTRTSLRDVQPALSKDTAAAPLPTAR